VERKEQRPFLAYKTVLQASLSQAFSEVGFEATAADFNTLRSILSEIAPHPEVPAALARLREHYMIAIISNTSDDLIAGTVRAIGTPIDFVITAEHARRISLITRCFSKRTPPWVSPRKRPSTWVWGSSPT